MKPAVFFDRDGTLNVEKAYLYRVEDWEWLPYAKEALAVLRKAGYARICVSNQSGIGRGYYSTEDVEILHMHIQEELGEDRLDALYFCPHAPDAVCECRKPSPYFLHKAAKKFALDLSNSWMVGDKAIDAGAGLAAGCKAILLETGYGAKEKEAAFAQYGAAFAEGRLFFVTGLREAVACILGKSM